MQIEVHGAQPHDLGDDVIALEGPVAHLLGDTPVLGGGLGLHVLIGRQQEPARAAGGIAHGLAGLGIYNFHHGVDQDARGEILAGPALHLARVALQQAFIDGPLGVDVDPHPGLAVDQADQPLQLGRVVDLALGLQEQGADDVGALRKRDQGGLVVGFQRLS